MSSSVKIKNTIRQSIISLINEKKQTEYGSVEYINELDSLISELQSLKNSLRKGPKRLKHRKEMHRLQDAIGAIRYLKKVAHREGVKNGLLAEGGLKAPELTGSVTLTPDVISKAIESYLSVINLWNQSLSSRGLDGVDPVGPVGSSAYHSVDTPETTYGDVDYLVSFPSNSADGMSHDEIRNYENEIKRKYEQDFRAFLNQSVEIDQYANAEATNRGSPFLVIVKIPSGERVQVDTIVTFPRYSPDESTGSQWMPARWTPERGLKGYTIGNLYTALGNYFNMSIGDRGVTAKIRDGERVSSRARKGAELKTISTNIGTFLYDIAKEIAGDNAVIGDALSERPGMNPENIRIQDLAAGIKALAETLEINNAIESSSNMISRILDLYDQGLRRNTDSKLSRGLDQESYEKLLKLNEKVYQIVKNEMEA